MDIRQLSRRPVLLVPLILVVVGLGAMILSPGAFDDAPAVAPQPLPVTMETEIDSADTAAVPAPDELEGEDLAEEAPPEVEVVASEVGVASYYGAELAGNPTATGEPFDPSKLTAAHRTLPFGTKLRVTSLATERSVVVRVNDRGPYAERRIIDLSLAAARQIGLVSRGVGRVRVEVLGTE